MSHLPSSDFYNRYIELLDFHADKYEKSITLVDRLVSEEISKNSNILEIGCGNGKRSSRLIRILSPRNFIAIDSSSNMVKSSRRRGINAHVDDIKKYSSDYKFDGVICLWNTFGHIGDKNEAIDALLSVANLLSSQGIFLLDLNNRYNFSHYRFSAILNLIRDVLHPSYDNGNFSFGAEVKREKILTKVHIFTQREIKSLLSETGLRIEKIYYYNYKSGELCASQFKGQMLLVVKKVA